MAIVNNLVCDNNISSISNYLLIAMTKWPIETYRIMQYIFYFMRYKHSMADIIVFQFWLLGLHEH